MTAAATDELTSTWTRAFGLAQVSHELERARRLGAKLVIAFLDVDGLKNVNDNHGHLAGDALLRLVGETLRANVRPYDVLVRYGGDEFCARCRISPLPKPDHASRRSRRGWHPSVRDTRSRSDSRRRSLGTPSTS